MRTLADLISHRQKHNKHIEGLHLYTVHALDEAVLASFASSHKRFRAAVEDKPSQGMIKAALFSALRQHLPRGWFVQVDAPYPSTRSHDNPEADLLVWTPDDVPVVFEVCAQNSYEAISRDLDTINRHATRLKSSPVGRGYVVFPVYDPRHLSLWREMRNEWRPAWPIPIAMF